MAAITDLSYLINRMSGGNNGTPENIFAVKFARTGGTSIPFASSSWSSLWRADGTYSGAATPTTGAIPTNTTQGAVPFTSPGGSREKWLIQAFGVGGTTGVFVLYDRLFHIGGLSGTSTSDQTVQGSPASPSITRNTGGVGNIVFAEIYTSVGATATTLTMTYTNSTGTAGRTSTATFGGAGTNPYARMTLIPLASGDVGVQSVEKVALTATTGTAGNFGITIARPLAYLPLQAAGIPTFRDFTTGLPSIPKIDSDACLALAYIPSTNTSSEMFFGLSFIEK